MSGLLGQLHYPRGWGLLRKLGIAGFVDYYDHRRYHKALGNMAPYDVIDGKQENIRIKRKQMKAQTLANRKRYNRLLKKSNNKGISP